MADYVAALYKKTKRENLVKKSYFVNYDIDEARWFDDVRFMNGNDFTNQVDILVGGSPCQSFSTYGKSSGWKTPAAPFSTIHCHPMSDVDSSLDAARIGLCDGGA